MDATITTSNKSETGIKNSKLNWIKNTINLDVKNYVLISFNNVTKVVTFLLFDR